MEETAIDIIGTRLRLYNIVARPNIDLWTLLDEVTGRTTITSDDGLAGMKHALQRHIEEYSLALKFVVELEEARQA